MRPNEATPTYYEGCACNTCQEQLPTPGCKHVVTRELPYKGNSALLTRQLIIVVLRHDQKCS